ncbi:MAG TPA: ectonucleotide pyrophosphatase/phosphodiesterase, partial [Puia sp.]|nr:ectonucleotide pyrophosphatase/phosphodiesterase [Puia sp.]
MRLFLFLLFIGCVGSLSAQVTDTAQKIIPGRVNSPEHEKEPYVIFISADGFRYDLADKYHATHLQALRARGVAAASMTPAFPSVTFPNHYSLATGLYPAHHGLVDNTFYDPEKGKGYRINDRAAVTDSSWYGGTPIWVLAEQQRMLSASFFWVGSEAAVDGVRPTYYYLF